MYDMEITTVRQVPARRAPAVDIYLEDNQELLKELYDRWGTGISKYGWASPISMRGGISTITVKMIKDIPQEELEKVYYKRKTKQILDAIENVVVV